MNTKHLVALTSLTLSLASIGSAAAVVEESLLPQERYTIRLGAFFVQDIDTTMRVDGKLTASPHGTEINLGDRLNVDNSVQVFRGDFSAYLAKRHRLDFTWFNMRLSGRATLGEKIDWGDTEFPQGITVESHIKDNIFRLSYTYFILQQSNMQLGLSLGAHIMKIDSGINAVNSSLAANEGFTAPLPVLGLVFDYAFSPTWLLRTHADYFGLSYDKYDGSLIDIAGAIEWRFNSWGSVGAGIEYFNINVSRDGAATNVDLDHKWLGYQAYVSFHF
jgi:hypothetical protein